MQFLETTCMSIVKPLLRAGGNGAYEVSYPFCERVCRL